MFNSKRGEDWLHNTNLYISHGICVNNKLIKGFVVDNQLSLPNL